MFSKRKRLSFYKHQDFKNDALSARRFIWQLSSVPNVRGFLSAVKDDLDRQMCLEVIDAFENEAMAIADELEKVEMKYQFTIIIFEIDYPCKYILSTY